MYSQFYLLDNDSFNQMYVSQSNAEDDSDQFDLLINSVFDCYVHHNARDVESDDSASACRS